MDQIEKEINKDEFPSNVTFKLVNGKILKTFFDFDTSIEVIKAFVSDNVQSLKEITFSISKKNLFPDQNKININTNNNNPQNSNTESLIQKTPIYSNPTTSSNHQALNFGGFPPLINNVTNSPKTNPVISFLNSPPSPTIPKVSPQNSKIGKANATPQAAANIFSKTRGGATGIKGATAARGGTASRGRAAAGRGGANSRGAAGSKGLNAGREGTTSSGAVGAKGAAGIKGANAGRSSSQVQSDKNNVKSNPNEEIDLQNKLSEPAKEAKDAGGIMQVPENHDKKEPQNEEAKGENAKLENLPKNDQQQTGTSVNADHKSEHQAMSNAASGINPASSSQVANDPQSMPVQTNPIKNIDMSRIKTFGDLVQKSGYNCDEDVIVVDRSYQKGNKNPRKFPDKVPEYEVEFIPRIYKRSNKMIECEELKHEKVYFSVLHNKHIHDIRSKLETQFKTGKYLEQGFTCSLMQSKEILAKNALPSLSKSTNPKSPRQHAYAASRSRQGVIPSKNQSVIPEKKEASVSLSAGGRTNTKKVTIYAGIGKKEDTVNPMSEEKVTNEEEKVSMTYHTILLSEKVKILNDIENVSSKDFKYEEKTGLFDQYFKQIYVLFVADDILDIEKIALEISPLCSKLYEKEKISAKEIKVCNYDNSEKKVMIDVSNYDLNELTVDQLSLLASQKLKIQKENFSLLAERNKTVVYLFKGDENVQSIINDSQSSEFMYIEITNRKPVPPRLLRNLKNLSRGKFNDAELEKIFFCCGRVFDLAIPTVEFYC